VFDALSARTERTRDVTVEPVSAAQLDEVLRSQIYSNDSSTRELDETTGLISIVGEMMNRANCSGASDSYCSSLHRDNCFDTDFTCGDCLSGYVPREGDYSCINASDPSTISERETSKQCMNGCALHGNCTFVNANTGLSQVDCDVSAADCEAVCVCEQGYNGLSCAVTDVQLEGKRNQRTALLLELLNNADASSEGNSTVDELKSVVSSLATLTQKRSEVSAEGSKMATSAVEVVLTQALKSEDVSVADMDGVMATIDTVAAVAAPSTQGAAEVASLIGLYGDLVAREMVAGEAVEVEYDNFKLNARAYSANEVVGESEELTLTIAPDSASTVRVTTVETKANLYGSESTNFLSNAKLVKIQGVESLAVANDTAAAEVLVVMRNNYIPDNWAAPQASVNFSTICTGANVVSYLTCPDSGLVIEHNCSGVSGTFVSVCPRLVPTCQSMDSPSSENCTMVSSDQSSITCSCLIKAESIRKRLQPFTGDAALEESGLLTLVAVGQYVADDFANTFVTAPHTLASLEKALLVILTFVVLWGVGLAAIFICTLRRQMRKKKVEEDRQELDKHKGGGELTVTTASAAVSHQVREEHFPVGVRHPPQATATRG
jgi:hypothetical protein